MTSHAGVVRNETGLLAGLSDLGEIEARFDDIGVHPDVAGFQDLAHYFDLHAAAIAARATLRAALERRETRGAHNRSDHPYLDPQLQVNLVWSLNDTIQREQIPGISPEVQALIEDVSADGKLVE
jgi:succinate dehydrogenase / fumarate reductase flavoprotein subunit